MAQSGDSRSLKMVSGKMFILFFTLLASRTFFPLSLCNAVEFVVQVFEEGLVGR